jgi:hypothetical protein
VAQPAHQEQSVFPGGRRGPDAKAGGPRARSFVCELTGDGRGDAEQAETQASVGVERA